jgi:TolA-binding protein
MHRQILPRPGRLLLPILVLLAAVAAQPVSAQVLRSPQERQAAAAQDPGENEAGAVRLLRTAQQYLENKEYERAVSILQSILERFPDSPVRHEAHLMLGRHYRDQQKFDKAVEHLRHVQILDQPGAVLDEAAKALVQETLYLLGACYYDMHQYDAAFPILRKLTRDHPSSVWANQAYYYIGMCHFMQKNWQKAIEALSLVGTFIDPSAPGTQLAEAGRRFYVRISDADLSVATRLGKEVSVELATRSGDRETLVAVPLTPNGDVYLGSIGTVIGAPKPGDLALQVTGGDEVTVSYKDANTRTGEYGVARQAKVGIVSTGSLEFTRGTYEDKAVAAFLNQPVFVALLDADKDTGPGAEEVEVRVRSIYKVRRDEMEESGNATRPAALLRAGSGESEFIEKTRDEVTLRVRELGSGAVRTGRFGATIELRAPDDAGANPSDAILTAATGDELVALYTDDRHLKGETPVEVSARTKVGGEIENRPKSTQYVVSDPVLLARKNLVESSAYLELGRIFRSMGLLAKAAEKCDQGLELLSPILRAQREIPPVLAQDAYRTKWELELAKQDFAGAMATCNVFSRLFPDSPIVDQALIGIGRIRLERKEYAEATQAFNQVLALPLSQAKAEAQFRIAETVELMNPENKALAIPAFKVCAERYPDSEFAGAALGKLVDHYIEAKDYRQAEEQIARVFEDHPDAKFLDGMLLKWVIVAYRMGDYAKSKTKCQQLLFEFPESPYAERAKTLLQQIEARSAESKPQQPS